MTKKGADHLWVRRPHGVACAKCYARYHWPAAQLPCKVPRADRATRSLEEVQAEVGRALDLVFNEDESYVCHTPTNPYGRDGRRRTGL